MRTLKLSSQTSSQGILRKQKSQIINAKYLMTNQYTSIQGQYSTSLEQLSHISIGDCLNQLNFHLSQNRPLKPAFVAQIKQYLNQLQKQVGEDSSKAQKKKKSSKEHKGELKFWRQSPYLLNYQLKKMKKQPFDIQIRRRTLKKRKMNAQNLDFEKENKLNAKSEAQAILPEYTLSKLRDQFNKVRGQMQNLKQYIYSHIQQIRELFKQEIKKIHDIAIKDVQSSQLCLKASYQSKEAMLKQAISKLQQQIQRDKKKETKLKEYLKERETQLATVLAAYNMQTF